FVSNDTLAEQAPQFLFLFWSYISINISIVSIPHRQAEKLFSFFFMRFCVSPSLFVHEVNQESSVLYFQSVIRERSEQLPEDFYYIVVS
ncbi:MAG: hypothetical protein ACP5RE_04070, partial [Candidatus Acidifodinimicrobium sp.]